MVKQYKIETYYYGKIEKRYQEVSSPVSDNLKNYYVVNNQEYVKTIDTEIKPGKKYYTFQNYQIKGGDNLNIIIPQQDSIKNIVDLAIQAYPGTKFSINGNSTPIIVGPSGIFQWKVLNNEGYINSIQFKEFPYEMNQNQLNQINMIVTYGYYEE